MSLGIVRVVARKLVAGGAEDLGDRRPALLCRAPGRPELDAVERTEPKYTDTVRSAGSFAERDADLDRPEMAIFLRPFPFAMVRSGRIRQM